MRYVVAASAMAIAQGNGGDTYLYVLAAANNPIRILGWGVSFDGKTAGEAKILCELCTSTVAGAGTAAGAVTEVKLDADRSETIQGAGQYGPYTAEPTALSVIHCEYVDNQAGWKEYFPDGYEIIVTGGKAACIRLTSPAAMTACNAACWLLCDE